MRPSDITDGIPRDHMLPLLEYLQPGFNEAVGYYRRNRGPAGGDGGDGQSCFNEAVGYYRRNPEW